MAVLWGWGGVLWACTAPGCWMELLRFSTGFGSCFAFNCHEAPGVDRTSRCGPADGCWHFGSTSNSTGHHPSCCTRELELLPPPKQTSPCVRVCTRMLLDHGWLSEDSGLEFRGNKAQ